MPSYNITIDDTSPMIRYEGTWKDAGTNGTDPMQPRYAHQTFHATQSVSSRAILKFNGTAVYIYGARRFNHGQFTVDVDGETESLDGKADPDEFQQVLYSKTGLSPNQEHEVTLTNGINPDYVDIDFIVATLGDGQEGMAQVEQFDDTTPKIGYSGNWEVNGPSQFIIQAFNASYRATKDPSGFLTLPFSGNGIRVYGGTGRNHGPYSVTLDGGQAQVYNGSTPSDVVYRGQQLLYLASNLPAGNHSLTLSNLGPQGSYVDIDYYVQETWPSSQTSSGLSAGAIAGIILASLFPLLLCAAVFFWRRRQRRRRVPSIEADGRSFFQSKSGPKTPVRPFIVIPTFPPASRISPASTLGTTPSTILAPSAEMWKALPFSEKSHNHPYHPDYNAGIGTMETRMVFAPNVTMEESGISTLSSGPPGPRRFTRPPSYMSTFGSKD